jgi:hypothetical protein
MVSGNREKEPQMRITNQKLLADATAIAFNGFFLNEETGEIRQGVAFSQLMHQLRDHWKNVSHITESDFEDSGFTLLTKYSNYRGSSKTPWVALQPDWKTGKIAKGRRVARTTWIIALPNTVTYEALESFWVSNHEQELKRREFRNQLLAEGKVNEMAPPERYRTGREIEARALEAFPKIPLAA